MLDKLKDSEHLLFFKEYVKLLDTSIKLRMCHDDIEEADSVEDLYALVVCSSGWGQSISGYSWTSRVVRWYQQEDVSALVSWHDTLRTTGEYKHKKIPLFPSMARRALKKVIEQRIDNTELIGTKSQETKEMSTVRNTANKVLDNNKTAAQVAAKISAGKAANSFLLNKLAALPAEIFGKKKEITNNPVAKLVTAELANTLATHFAGNNGKLQYVADAMLQEAMVDITANSDMLKNLVSELESVVNIPDLSNLDG